ncbi:Derlin [Plasmodiophora brassicae]|uniref:Uncharacterized protein n=1 Tax=Plasmodiophora brassicae TaxID=37360 RepID=A0A0G4IZ78_PLABS|nr:hypothetical protein PBRA_001493 [Plasmodiophora brassicae]SPQ94057.1 unnamed protein product [Plasmodiophora brassicae]
MTLIDVLQSLTVADVARLLLCIVVDLIGFVSYLVPGVGETVDVVWAPVSAICIRKLLPDPRLASFAFVGFIEEALPGLDFVPTAVCGWLYHQYLLMRDRQGR